MIRKDEVISFFNSLADGWDKQQITNDDIINTILNNADINKESRILDVACGTGVMIPYYLERGAASVTGVDISPAMIEKACAKFQDARVGFICADAETDDIGSGYTAIMIYNAFPHFSDPDKLLSHLCSLLAPGGTITVAHGSSREEIDAHHHGAAAHVSDGLMPAEQLRCMMSKYAEPTSMISDETMYLVSAVKK